MIKSEVRYDKSAEQVNGSGFSATVGLLAAILISAVVLAWLGAESWVAPLELLLWRPIIFGSACLAMAAWFKLRYADQAVDAWRIVCGWGIVGLAGGTVLGLVGYWHMNAAAMPLNLSSLFVYIVSLGGSQPLNGPDALMRGFAWSAAIASAVWSYRRGKDVWRAAIDALGTWAAATMVLILPSIILLVALGIKGVSPLVPAVDLVREFSRFSLHGYWSNLQMLRWFTGFGDQLAATMTLFTASWTFALMTVAVTVSNRHAWREWRGKINWFDLIIFALAPVAGLIAGWSRSSWSDLDLAAWLVLAFMIGAFLGGRAIDIRSKIENVNFWLVLALGAGLLGWPVAIAAAVTLVMLLIRSENHDSAASAHVQSWSQIGKDAGIWVALAVFGLMFVSRGDAPDPFMVRVALSACALVCPAWIAKHQQISGFWNLVVWLAGGFLAAVLIGTFAPMALVLFAVAVVSVLQRIKPSLSAWLPQIIIAYSVAVFILVIILPRLLNPRLMPL